MGCDIHIYTDPKTDFTPFDYRDYGMFGFLAGVRNYSCVPPISKPRGFPNDLPEYIRKQQEDWEYDGHTHSWLSIDELASFDYNQVFEDRRVTREVDSIINGAVIAESGEGEITTYREFLGEQFFEDLEKLQELGVKRIIFWFDN